MIPLGRIFIDSERTCLRKASTHIAPDISRSGGSSAVPEPGLGLWVLSLDKVEEEEEEEVDGLHQVQPELFAQNLLNPMSFGARMPLGHVAPWPYNPQVLFLLPHKNQKNSKAASLDPHPWTPWVHRWASEASMAVWPFHVFWVWVWAFRLKGLGS